MKRRKRHILGLSLVLYICLSACQSVSKKPQLLKLYAGIVERLNNFPSEYVSSRNVDIWLPNNYNDKKDYAVLYMHDGQMLFDSTTTWNKQEWGVDETMQQLITHGKIENTIVVGIWNTEFRHSEYFPQKPFESLDKAFQDSIINEAQRYGETSLFKSKILSDSYLRFIVEELKPYIDKHYPTLSDFKHTSIAGSSMGGLISMYALCEYPEVFSAAACLSTHWVGTFDTLNNPIPKAFENYLDQNLPPPNKHKIYFDFGTETLDALYEPYQIRIDSVMIQRAYEENLWITNKYEGKDHSENAWKERLAIPLEFILN